MDPQQLAREINNMTNVLASAHYAYETYINSLNTLYNRVMSGRLTREAVVADKAKINEIFAKLQQCNQSFGSNVNKFNKQISPQMLVQLKIPTSQVKTQAMVNDLMKLADALDGTDRELANHVDGFLRNASLGVEEDLEELVFTLASKSATKICKAELVAGVMKLADFSDEIGAHVLADELDKIAEEVSTPIQHPNEGSLSTRYCPDHNGIQAVRISERIYQCPVDGKIYNYENGYINYKGQRVPGGSVAAQTPTTSDFGGIPMRIYDSRQNILNRIN